MTRFLSLIVFLAMLLPAISNADVEWPGGAEVAVALTYDDALDSQLDHALPALEARGFKGTFYVTVGSGSMVSRLPEWRHVAELGHELGNHSIYHPCSAQGPDRAWVEPWNDLDHKPVARLRRELEIANAFLYAVDGKTRRSYAATCYDKFAAGEFYWPEVADLFGGFRDLDDGMAEDAWVYWGPSDPETSGADLVRFVTDNEGSGHLVVFVFHGVGGDHLSVTPAAHAELLDFLAARPDRYWVDTYLNIVDHVASQNDDGEIAAP